MAPKRKNRRKKSSIGDGLYLVDRIVDRCITKTGKLLYLVKWKGYKSIHNTWEPKDNITLNCIKEYENIQEKLGKNNKKTEKTPKENVSSPFQDTNSSPSVLSQNGGKDKSQKADSKIEWREFPGSETHSMPKKVTGECSTRLRLLMEKHLKSTNWMTVNPVGNPTSPERVENNLTLEYIENEASLAGLELEAIEESAFYSGQQVFLVKFKNKDDKFFVQAEVMNSVFPNEVAEFYRTRIVAIMDESSFNLVFGGRLLDFKHPVPRGIVFKSV